MFDLRCGFVSVCVSQYFAGSIKVGTCRRCIRAVLAKRDSHLMCTCVCAVCVLHFTVPYDRKREETIIAKRVNCMIRCSLCARRFMPTRFRAVLCA